MDIARIWIMHHDENLSVFFCHAMKIVRNVSTADKEHNNFFIVLQISISDWRLCVDWQMFVSFFCAKNFQGFLNWQIFKWYLSGKASGQIMFERKNYLSNFDWSWGFFKKISSSNLDKNRCHMIECSNSCNIFLVYMNLPESENESAPSWNKLRWRVEPNRKIHENCALIGPVKLHFSISLQKILMLKVSNWGIKLV